MGRPLQLSGWTESTKGCHSQPWTEQQNSPHRNNSSHTGGH